MAIRRWTSLALPWLLMAAIIGGCASPGTTSRTGASGGEGQRATPKRITVAIMDDPPGLYSKLTPPSIRGIDAVEELIHVGLANVDNTGQARPLLARSIPSLENGEWTLLADGRMETTWRLRENARWQDGAPFTTEDLAFTAALAQDREVAELRDAAFDAVDDLRVIDAQTVVVSWKRPFIDADKLFTRVGPTRGRVLPLPKHRLEASYREDKPGFTQLSFWSDDFLGTGPFKLKSWEKGSHLVLEASEAYVMGRPKIDQIEVRFVPDPNTLVANVLAGSVQFTLGRGLALEQALLMRDQWADGRMEVSQASWFMVWPQFLNPSPAIISDVRFRRAMAMAIDRQQLSESLTGGISGVAHTYLAPTEPDWEEITADAPRYLYDPRAATQQIEALGYASRPDGFLYDSAGQRLGVELRTTAGDTMRERMQLTTADSWQRIGVAAEPVQVSRTLAQDQEYRATFPSFELSRNPNQLSDLPALHSRSARLPENNFRGSGGTNYPRYMNASFDTLIERYFVTISKPERIQIARQIVTQIADQVVAIGMLYSTEQNMISNRLVNATGRSANATEAWNAHEWDLRS